MLHMWPWLSSVHSWQHRDPRQAQPLQGNHHPDPMLPKATQTLEHQASLPCILLTPFSGEQSLDNTGPNSSTLCPSSPATPSWQGSPHHSPDDLERDSLEVGLLSPGSVAQYILKMDHRLTLEI